jgi:hypothetical protein
MPAGPRLWEMGKVWNTREGAARNGGVGLPEEASGKVTGTACSIAECRRTRALRVDRG